MKLLATSLAVVLALAPATAEAQAPSLDLLRTFASTVSKIKRSTATPVLLPSTLPVRGKHKVYAQGAGNRGSWELDLGFAPGCGLTTACFLASFQAARNGSLPRKANAHLAGGDPAYFHASTCGGSCAPATLWFVHAHVVYAWQDSDIPVKTPKAFLIGLANEAIAAGPR